MEQLGVLQALKDSPDLQNLFVGGPPAPLTSSQVKDLFGVIYSVAGSSRRSAEERAVAFWRDWLVDIEEGEAVLHVDGQEPVKLTLEVVLAFATGAERIPPLGFDPNPTLDFLHDFVNNNKRVFPEANTCALVLRLPLHGNYEDFSSHMLSGILQSPTFGTA
ncbi:G2/M phase-specific E3 ubiquitin-protein ligase [Merluccius polli]|nr:G2/M phase-specific E3 ubiquitin-protein ligase [Merluccius polli]KAK0141184.1 G2/M phase-specific E3 ubiquitin-protein ligase [Merluccius polli]KAK0143204.1 G2/M phase-specific E3 ubiquitin-protein ligase [Merluccius polli]